MKLLASVPFCDLVDMVARLRAAQAVAEILAANGIGEPDHETTIHTLVAYQEKLQVEAEVRMAQMREESRKR